MQASMAVIVFGVMVGTIPLGAQTQPEGAPAQAAPPAQSPPAQAAPPAETAPQPPAPFPEGARVAFVDFQRIANESIEGKAAAEKVQALNQQKVQELNVKQKELAGAQQKLQQGLTVLSVEARARLQKEIERIQVDIERFTQDAQTEVQELQQELMIGFQRNVLPIIAQVGIDKGLHVVFSAEAGIVWAAGGLDVTAEVITRFDAAPQPEQ